VNDWAIEVDNAFKRFGSTVAVNHLSLKVRRGECYGLIGPNGAGKTTTFSMMCGYLRPNEGQIRIIGKDPIKPGALKGVVGVLPQDAALPAPGTVGSVLTYWARLSALPDPEREAKEALERVGLVESWGTSTQALSHGMAKRISLAQSLMGTPPVLLLDEPTAGLDPRIAAQVRQLMRELKGHRTLVVSSHNLHELEELCDAAAILDRGTLVEAGSMAELTSKSAEFRVEIARGTVPVEELTLIPGCVGATLDPSGNLVVRFKGTPEEVISPLVGFLLSRGVLILGVTRGRKLEERVLEVT
jgi:ABC-type multidrug transport system ATPase subunit